MTIRYLSLAILLFSNLLYADNNIDWYIYDRPPAHILSGPNTDQGYLDKLLALTVKELPEYRHNKVQATISRGLYDMKHGKNVCHLSIFKTEERSQYTYFSTGFIMSPNLRVIISNKLKKSLNLDEQVSLDSLFSKHNLRTLKLPERSYTKIVDNVLEQYPTLVKTRTSYSEEGLYSMLIKGRADFLIAVPSSANFALKDAADSFTSIKINGVPEYGTAYIGCSKTAWGKELIQKLNKALHKIRHTDAYLEAMTTWLPKVQINDAYMQYYRDQFLRKD